MPRINMKATEGERFYHKNDWYLVRCSKVEMATSTTNNPMLRLEYTTIAPNSEADGKIIYDRLSLVDAAGWRVKQALEGFNIPHTAIPIPDVKGGYELDFDSDDLLNAECLVRTEQEIYTQFERGTTIPVKDAATGKNKTGIRVNVEEYKATGPTAATVKP